MSIRCFPKETCTSQHFALEIGASNFKRHKCKQTERHPLSALNLEGSVRARGTSDLQLHLPPSVLRVSCLCVSVRWGIGEDSAGLGS